MTGTQMKPGFGLDQYFKVQPTSAVYGKWMEGTRSE